MPLKCRDHENRIIHSFDLSPEAWLSLGQDNRKRGHLFTACCNSPVSLKHSHLGTQFFAHKVRRACAWAPETEFHLRLKQLAIEVARENGWQAEPEVPGQTPSGEQWKADVLAQKGNLKVAIEIQWSGQTEKETYRRQEGYKQSGVRCLWLMRRCGFVPNKETPAVEIVDTPDGDFTALIGRSDQKTAIPIRDLLNACFQKRFRFGVPLGIRANVSVSTGTMTCWKCRAETRIISSVDIQFGTHIRRFPVAECEKYMDLFSAILSSLSPKLKIGTIKSRYSKALEVSYLSNGCFHCDALIDNGYEHEAGYGPVISYYGPVISYPEIEISERWRQAIIADGSFEFGWGIYE